MEDARSQENCVNRFSTYLFFLLCVAIALTRAAVRLIAVREQQTEPDAVEERPHKEAAEERAADILRPLIGVFVDHVRKLLFAAMEDVLAEPVAASGVLLVKARIDPVIGRRDDVMRAPADRAPLAKERKHENDVDRGKADRAEEQPLLERRDSRNKVRDERDRQNDHEQDEDGDENREWG